MHQCYNSYGDVKFVVDKEKDFENGWRKHCERLLPRGLPPPVHTSGHSGKVKKFLQHINENIIGMYCICPHKWI